MPREKLSHKEGVFVGVLWSVISCSEWQNIPAKLSGLPHAKIIKLEYQYTQIQPITKFQNCTSN
jgi:hypothetical protein